MVPRFQNGLEHLGAALLHFLHRYAVLLTIVIIAAFIIWVATEIIDTILDAKAEVDNRPKEDMVWCHRHGPIRKKHMLKLFPHMKKTDGTDFEFCPLCYKENVYDNVDMKAARDGKSTLPTS